MDTLEPRELYVSTKENWRQVLDYITTTMREVSLHTEPSEMVTAYSARIRSTMPSDRFLSLSRRGVEPPQFIVARDLGGLQESDPVDVWTDRNRLPHLSGGLMGELFFSNRAHIIDDLEADPNDPGIYYLRGYKSLLAIPVFDGGEALNMIVMLRKERASFDRLILPQIVWTTNLFGRATHNLVLRKELEKVNQVIEREMQVIADIQRSLLPAELPKITTLDLAAHYQPARVAGGDYYDFFPLRDGKLGLFIADVSGHGSPAAVHMAITHTLAHTKPEATPEPGDLLGYVNHHLARRYSMDGGNFVTAFFGVYDPASRAMTYACAGHPPPRVKRCSDGSLFLLDQSQGLPLGIMEDQTYEPATVKLSAGDQIIFYTDGITEAFNPDGEMFGVERLDAVLENCSLTARGLIDDVLSQLQAFARGREAGDDRTLLVARVT